MNGMTKTSLALAVMALPSLAVAGRSQLMIPPSDAFLLGGEQRAAMTVSGKNVGPTNVVILSRTGAKESVIASVNPGGSFQHRFAVGQTALIRNRSATATARLSVDFTGSPAELSMRYAHPTK